MNNLKFGTVLSFEQLIEHGLSNGANVVNGMPWSWSINGKSVTHENDCCYLIETMNGIQRFEKGDKLIATEKGIRFMISETKETHSPGGCPL